MDGEFLLADCTSFHPHTEVDVIPDELLNEFCCEHGATFLSAVKLAHAAVWDTFFRGRCSVYDQAF